MRIGHEGGLGGLHVSRERGGELGAIEEKETVLRRQDRRHGSAGRRIGDQRRHRLTLIGGKGRDVDEALDLGVVAGIGDDDTAVGVADQDDRAVLSGNGALGDGNVVFQRDGRVLHDRHLIAVLGEDVVDAFPAGAVDETAVDQQDVFNRGGRRRGRVSGGEACGSGKGNSGSDQGAELGHDIVSL